jgi:hypothetical protein
MNNNQLYLGDDGEFTVDVILPGERHETVRATPHLMPHERRLTDGKSKPKSVPNPGQKRAGDSLEGLTKVAVGFLLFLMVLFGIVFNEQDGPYQPVVVPVDQPAAVPTEQPCLVPPVDECVVPNRFNTYSHAPCQIVELADGKLAVSDGCRVYDYSESGMLLCLDVQRCLADED